MTSRNAAEALRDTATEDEWQSTVLDYARLRGWIAHHDRPARTSRGWTTPIQGTPGFPDLVLVRFGDPVLFVELKSATGRLSDDQRRWQERLVAAGAEYRLWRPCDWDEVRRTLDAPKRPAL